MPRAKTCRPPKAIQVKGHWRQVRKTRKKKRAAPASKGPYWSCVSARGAACGVHHKSLTGAVRHRKQLDKKARAYRAKHGGKLNDWHVERKGSK